MTLTLGQLLMISSLGFLVFYFFKFRSEITDRLFYILVIGLGIGFILKPNLSTLIANMLGIGRGTDLLLYAFIIISLFTYSSISVKFRKTDQNLTQIVRALAIARAERGEFTDRGENS